MQTIAVGATLCQAAIANDISSLNVPMEMNGTWPALLSQTGAFKDTRALAASEAMLPYDLNVPFWSDGASKQRWMALPPGKKIRFSASNEWSFPTGTVFVKHFELSSAAKTGPTRRLETRLLVVNPTGGVHGVTYKWRSDNSDAELLETNVMEELSVHTAAGVRAQNWFYPGRIDCLTCHTPLNGGVLGVNTRQLNRDFAYASGTKSNQLVHWTRLGLFENPPATANPDLSYAKLVAPGNRRAPIEERARSWLDANCSHCHRPGGTVANFDARYTTPLAEQKLLDGPVLIDQGIDNARVIAPNDIWRSILLMRVNSREAIKMPPLAHEVVDDEGAALLREWIQSLPGPQVLPPPAITPAGGEFRKNVQVKLLHPDRDTAIRYTLDGSAPTKSALLYTNAIELTGPVTLRARAFKTGFTKSIAVQETFIVGN
jgi:uncharacterized repeat protein (TIGR03806 family)